MIASPLDKLLARHGLQALHSRCVARLDCEVHRITLAAGAGELALRIYAASRQDTAPILAELRWLQALAEAGLHVPRPLQDAEGRWLHTWPAGAAGEAPRHAVLLRWLPGRVLDRGLRPLHLRRLGGFVARTHQSARQLALVGALATPRLAWEVDLAGWAAGAPAHAGWLPPRLLALSREMAARLQAVLLPQLEASVGQQFVHGDLHLWNLLFHRDQAGAIDFSDCGWGPPALDLAAVLQYLRHPLAGNHDHGALLGHLQAQLLAGYAAVQPLPADIDAQIDSWLLARLFTTLHWILEDWPRPDHRAWGPRFLQGCEQAFDRACRAA